MTSQTGTQQHRIAARMLHATGPTRTRRAGPVRIAARAPHRSVNRFTDLHTLGPTPMALRTGGGWPWPGGGYSRPGSPATLCRTVRSHSGHSPAMPVPSPTSSIAFSSLSDRSRSASRQVEHTGRPAVSGAGGAGARKVQGTRATRWPAPLFRPAGSRTGRRSRARLCRPRSRTRRRRPRQHRAPVQPACPSSPPLPRPASTGRVPQHSNHRARHHQALASPPCPGAVRELGSGHPPAESATSVRPLGPAAQPTTTPRETLPCPSLVPARSSPRSPSQPR